MELSVSHIEHLPIDSAPAAAVHAQACSEAVGVGVSTKGWAQGEARLPHLAAFSASWSWALAMSAVADGSGGSEPELRPCGAQHCNTPRGMQHLLNSMQHATCGGEPELRPPARAVLARRSAVGVWGWWHALTRWGDAPRRAFPSCARVGTRRGGGRRPHSRQCRPTVAALLANNGAAAARVVRFYHKTVRRRGCVDRPAAVRGAVSGNGPKWQPALAGTGLNGNPHKRERA